MSALTDALGLPPSAQERPAPEATRAPTLALGGHSLVEQGSSRADSLRPLCGWLSEAFGATSLVYRVKPARDGWHIDQMHWAGEGAAERDLAFREYYRCAPLAHTSYDPLRPDAAERNRPLILPPVGKGPAKGKLAAARRMLEQTHVVQHFYPRADLLGQSQLRVVVCDGPLLLSWVGFWRPQAFGADDTRRLWELVPGLIQKLRWEQRMREPATAGVVRLIEAIDAPAYLVRSSGVVEHANTAGQYAYSASLREKLWPGARPSSLGQPASAGEPLAESEAGGTIERIDLVGTGMPGYSVVVLRGTGERRAARLGYCSRVWALTPTEWMVLDRMVSGDTNKEAAQKLNISPRTAEVHVANILRKARVDSRARLVARFWEC